MAEVNPDPADAAAWGGTGRSTPIWVDADDWDEKDIPRRPWVVPGFALRGSVSLLTGPPSAMKSSLTLSFAVATALRASFGLHFCPCSAERVIIYNVEDDRDEQLSTITLNDGPRVTENDVLPTSASHPL
jgi:RecA-family ATPase